jgi:hypothetical protein
MAATELTLDLLLQAFIKAGYNSENIVDGLLLLKSFQDVGITPVIFTPMLMRLKLIDDRMTITQKIEVRKADQQQQIGQIIEAVSPEINSLNSQLSDINAQLAQLQG